MYPSQCESSEPSLRGLATRTLLCPILLGLIAWRVTSTAKWSCCRDTHHHGAPSSIMSFLCVIDAPFTDHFVRKLIEVIADLFHVISDAESHTGNVSRKDCQQNIDGCFKVPHVSATHFKIISMMMLQTNDHEKIAAISAICFAICTPWPSTAP